MPDQNTQPGPPNKNSYRKQDFQRKTSAKPPAKPNRPMRTFLVWMVIIGVVWMIVLLVSQAGPKPEELTQTSFKTLFESKEIKRIEDYVNPSERELKIFKKNTQPNEPPIVMPISDGFWEEDWAQELKKLNNSWPEEERVEMITKRENRMWSAILFNMLPWLLIFVVIYFFFFRQLRASGGAGGVLSFGRSQARMITKDNRKVTFADVAGIEEAKEEVGEIIEFLKNPAKFQKLGGRIPRGVLLVGSPGTGKTLLAKAIAGEADVPFFSISGSDFVEMFVGVGASRVRDLFKRAKESSPCLIFLDEVDAVGRRRGAGLGGGHDEREQTLNAILVEMDGFESDDGIILIAATNRPDVLDPALMRPGRFDREIVIDLPDVKGREEILKVHARHIKISEDVDLKIIARGTPMFSGADLEALINEAALAAVMADKDSVTIKELEEARDKVLWGRQKKSRMMDKDDKKIIAYHESGHAIIAKLLPEVEPLHKVTIVPRGMALGSTMSLPERDVYLRSKHKLLGEITSCLGGRVSEEIFLGKENVTSGAQNDFEQATRLARNMVTRWGMSDKVGTIDYAESEEHLFLGRDITRSKTHSEATSLEIDKEVKQIIDSCYQRARDLIESHRKEVDIIAEALLRHEVLDALDIDWIIEGKDIDQRKQEQAKQEQIEMAKAEAKNHTHNATSTTLPDAPLDAPKNEEAS